MVPDFCSITLVLRRNVARMWVGVWWGRRVKSGEVKRELLFTAFWYTLPEGCRQSGCGVRVGQKYDFSDNFEFSLCKTKRLRGFYAWLSNSVIFLRKGVTSCGEQIIISTHTRCKCISLIESGDFFFSMKIRPFDELSDFGFKLPVYFWKYHKSIKNV